MKPKRQQTGFTIIELLTIMSIIIIIIGALLPALAMVNWYAKYTTQKNQFRNIDTGLQAFEIDYGEYPDSNTIDIAGASYCGAMKLAEAMAGQDGLGFHPDSMFRADGKDAGGTDLYPRPAPNPPTPAYLANLQKRKEYTEGKDIQLGSLTELFTNSGAFSANATTISLLCDVYKRSELRNSRGTKLGMPILYYRANTTKILHDVDNPGNPGNIYNYKDNHELLALGVRWDPAIIHQLYQANSGPPLYAPTGGPAGQVFYKMTQDKSALPIKRPYNKNGYILISAGGDGVYGTLGSLRTRDVVNFSD